MAGGPALIRGRSPAGVIGALLLTLLVLSLLAWTARGRLFSSRAVAPAVPADSAPTDPTEARLRQVIARQPQDANAHRDLGRYALSVARPASALWELAEAGSLGADDPSVRLDRAQALAAAGRRPAAIAELRVLLKAGTAAAPARLAELLLETGQAAEAERLLTGTARETENPSEAARLLGRAYHALGRLPEAEAAFRRCAELAPTDAARFQPLGRFLLATGRPEEARPALMQDQRVAFRTAELHYLLGLTYLRARPRADLGKASAALTVALLFDPVNAWARASLAEVLERQGAREQAVTQYEEAIRRDPRQPEPHERLAALLEKMGQQAASLQQRGIAATMRDQLPEAESAFGRMLAAEPANLAAIQSYILTDVAMKRVDRSRPAVQALQRRQFDPATAERVAQLFLMTGSRDLCRRLAEEWRQREPKAPGPLRLLGRLAVDDLRTTEGIKLYEQAWEQDPQDAATAAALGIAFGRVPSRPNLQRAAEWLQRAVALAPDNPQYHHQQAEVLRQLGQEEEAREAYLRALDLDPSLTVAYNGLVRLAQAMARPRQAELFSRIVREADNATREQERLYRRVWDSPTSAEARLELARFLLRSDELWKARGHLDAALAQRPGWKPALELRRTVDSLLAWP
jgi:tetratricopeptide (TPR) repeat protein